MRSFLIDGHPGRLDFPLDPGATLDMRNIQNIHRHLRRTANGFHKPDEAQAVLVMSVATFFSFPAVRPDRYWSQVLRELPDFL